MIKIIINIIGTLLISVPYFAEAQPSALFLTERVIDWSQTGIPGGIPDRQVVCSTINSSTYGDASTNATAAIQSAIDSCSADQVVRIPAGVYLISSSLNVTKGVVLRGDGASKTILKSAPLTTINIGSGSLASTFIDISSGYSKGSTTMTLADASSVSVGDYLVISQENDYLIVNNNGIATSCTWCGVLRCSSNHNINSPGWSNGASCDNGAGIIEGGKRTIGQIIIITAKNGNTISFEPSLSWPYYTSALEPKVIKIKGMIKSAGVESLKIEFSSTDIKDAGTGINIKRCAQCWVQGIEIAKAPRRGIETFQVFRNEYRDNYFHDTYSLFAQPNHGYGVLLTNYSTSNRIENNIFNLLEAQMVIEQGSSGNVLSYNYVKDKSYYSANWLMHTLASHAAHPSMNLVEGNIGQGGISQDFIHGSASHQTFFRNRILGYQATAADGTPVVNGLWVIILDKNNHYMNFVGNVLGTGGVHDTYEIEGINTSNRQKVIYRLGYESPGDASASGNDPGVKATLYRHGNFDYATGTTAWDNSVSNHSIPPSLYLISKPSWFGSVPWPPIGPDVSGGNQDPSGHAYKIPAMLCFENQNLGNGGTFDPNACYRTQVPLPPTNLRVMQ